jgi:8-oxo-dGTP pyrophosphatase MutT (NUDIX family)/protein-tyrosine-phosphatase
MKSLSLPGFEFSSSGLAAGFHIQPLPRHTTFVAIKHNLSSLLSKGQVQTTSELLKSQDLIIFMHHDLYRDAVQAYNLDPRKCLYWDVADLWQALLKYGDKGHDWKIGSVLAEETFQKIKQRCDALTKLITKTSWVEVVDAENKKTDLSLPLDWVDRLGLWSRGIHALIATADGRYLVEKRSPNIVFAPGLIDVSMGGSVDFYEEPAQALMREIKEELGLSIKPSQARLLEVRKQSSYHSSYKRYSRGFIYSYYVQLADNNPIINIERSEVSQVKFLSQKQLKRLLKRHGLRHLGRLNYQHKLYNDAINLSQNNLAGAKLVS